MDKLEKLVRSKTKRPNRFLYGFFKFVVCGSMKRRVNVQLVNCDIISNCNEPYVVLSNHVSRSDFVFAALACKNPMHFVATHYEFYNKTNRKFIKQLGAIPKYLYQKDVYSIIEMMRVAKRGENLMLFPEGILSVTGSNRPIIPGTGRFLQKLGLKVFVLNIKGAYSVRPRFAQQFHKGNVVIEACELVNASDLKKIDAGRLDDMIREAISHDENKFMATQPPMIASKDGFAYNMQSTLYHCPHCGSDGTMRSDKNFLYCTNCSARATVDGRLNINDVEGCESFGYHTIKDWWQYQSDVCGKIIEGGGTFISDNAEMFTLDQNKVRKNPYISVGKGKVWLDSEGFHYLGTRNGEQFSWFVPTESQPALPAGNATYVESYYDGQYYRFMLENNAVSMKWNCLTAEQNKRGGKWPM